MTAKFRAGKDQSTVLENVETLTGQRGDGRNRAVTYGDLATLGLANLRQLGGGKVTLTPGNGSDGSNSGGGVQKPTKPTNFKATGGFAYVLLEWDMPNYRGRSLTEIYRSPEDNLANAVLIASSAAGVYGDPVDPDWKGYYWIRHVNALGEPGPFNDSKGTFAQTHPDPAAIIEVITEQLNASPLIQKLGEDLQDSIKQTDKKIGEAKTELTHSLNGLNRSVDELNQAIGDAKTKIGETKDDLSAIIKEEEHARINGDKAITTQVNGIITEFRGADQALNATIGELSKTTTAADQALSEKIIALDASFKKGDQALSSSINELSRTTTAADQALSERISSIDAAYKKADQTLNGSISELGRSTASADQVLSERVNAVDAAYKKADQTVTANITELAKTVADKTQALSQQISQVESGYKNADSSLSAKVQQESESRTAADTAIGKRVDTVSANLDKNIAAVQTNAQAIAALDGVKSMWTVKAQAGNITAGIGIVASKDSSGNSISQVAVAANQFFIYDPNNPNDKTTYAIPFAISNGKVVIDELIAKEAVIKILAAQTIIADSVKAGIEIVSPYIKTARIESGNFTVDQNGNMTAKNAKIEGEITATSGSFTGTVNAKDGVFRGTVYATDGEFSGTVYANKIVGDVVKPIIHTIGSTTIIPAESFIRRIFSSPVVLATNANNGGVNIYFDGNNVMSASGGGGRNNNSMAIGVISANEEFKITSDRWGDSPPQVVFTVMKL
ncbi:phage tail tip protein [Pectobacterium punjabense]|uniref:phage tail tip protein n=1 Tax=Pectobacterium punjabense TaxID=2108399 RepID=UPI002405CB44|nr:DUF1983 domain-containing protein [Pectobacterium punjabense]MDG0795640.1 DUF1983 domain-containing protein [Pectobacterium punjabense]